jgi:hypothetical protein
MNRTHQRWRAKADASPLYFGPRPCKVSNRSLKWWTRRGWVPAISELQAIWDAAQRGHSPDSARINVSNSAIA